eukprot:GHVU01088731.1.p1 GENE.GHVU01088731.1~~GHVU01088731.1.p1  ORF type:complete len:159 (-),score=9.16 GHVU01088731.1:244-720(-)
MFSSKTSQFLRVAGECIQRQARLRSEMCINEIQLLGWLGRKPDPIDEGRGVLMRCATKKRLPSEQGPVEVQNWHRVVSFKPSTRDFALNVLDVGDRIFVKGSVQYKRLEQGDLKGSVMTTVMADEIILINKRKLRNTSESEPQDSEPEPEHLSTEQSQ